MKHLRRSRLFLALVALMCVVAVSATSPASAAAKKKTTKKKVVVKTTKGRSTASPTKTTKAPTSDGLPKDLDREGEMVWSYPLGTSSLDPAKGPGGSVIWLSQVCDQLTTVDSNLNIVPRLATSWSFPDASTFEMTLRSDVSFHDGTKFDANVVKANINRSKNLPGSLLAGSLVNITGMQVVNPTTIRFTLSKGGAELPSLFAAGPGTMLSTKVLDKNLDGGPGDGCSGPYNVVKFRPQESLTLVQAQAPGTFWDPKAGLIKKITINYIPDGTQRMNAVLSGEVTLAQITSSDIVAAKRLLDEGRVKGFLRPTAVAPLNIMMRTTRPPFDNPTFRKAMQYALDRDTLIKGVYGGACTKTDQVYLPGHWAHVDELDGSISYSPGTAKALIERSGIKNPSFSLDYLPIYEKPANAVQGLLREVGINVKLNPIPSGDRGFQLGNSDAIYGTLPAGIDPSQAMANSFLPTSLLNLMKDPDGSFTALANRAGNPSLTTPQAKALYTEAFERIQDEAVTVPVCTGNQAWIHTGKIANLTDIIGTANGQVYVRNLYIKK